MGSNMRPFELHLPSNASTPLMHPSLQVMPSFTTTNSFLTTMSGLTVILHREITMAFITVSDRTTFAPTFLLQLNSQTITLRSDVKTKINREPIFYGPREISRCCISVIENISRYLDVEIQILKKYLDIQMLYFRIWKKTGYLARCLI